MKKKRNEYKPHRYKNLPGHIFSVLVILLLIYIFTMVGYSVAKPFGEIGEASTPDADSSYTLSSKPSEPAEIKDENAVHAYMLTESEIDDIDQFRVNIQLVQKKDFNTVIVPLKLKGGRLNFSFRYEGSELDDVCNDNDLSQICRIIRECGFDPAASINTMEDNLYPLHSAQAGFLLKSNKKLWYDKQSADGKPWLDPASSETKKYLAAISDRIAAAGFTKIICRGVKYPPFTQDALDDIGGTVTKPDRYLDLINDVNAISENAANRGGEAWLEVSAYEVLTDTSEVFYKPIMLDTQKYVLHLDLDLFKEKVKINGKDVDFSKLSYSEKIEVILTQMEKKVFKTSFVPEITGDATTQQKSDAVKVFEKLNYNSYIIG